VQFAGKDQVRQQAAMWQAMLLSADLAHSKQIFIHGFMTVDGQKISKSLGNVINPIEIVEKYGTDPLRYYLLAKIHPSEDSDFSWDKFKDSYNADLANGLGNLIARVAKLCENAQYVQMGSSDRSSTHMITMEAYDAAMQAYKFSDALGVVWKKIGKLDKFIDEEKPWELIKSINPRIKDVLAHAVDQIQEIAGLLTPFLPETAEKITQQFKQPEIKAQPPLFPRMLS
jgi:methionyl-tRNA synthetase